jgi:hypothetical protein
LVKEWDFVNPPCFICLDRRGKNDLIGSNNYYCNTDLEEAIGEYGFIPVTGSISDADEFNELAPSCNLSIGYYNQHTKNEFLNVDILKTVPVLGMSEGLKDRKFDMPEQPKWNKWTKYSSWNSYSGSSWTGVEDYDKYDDLEDSLYGDSSYVQCDICGSFCKESTFLHYEGYRFCPTCCEEISAHVIR